MNSIPGSRISVARVGSFAGALTMFALLAACSEDVPATNTGNANMTPNEPGVSADGGTPSRDVPDGGPASVRLDGGATPAELPVTAAEIGAFIDRGAYKAWRSEPAVHAARSPSPHGFNRVYSNPAIAGSVDGTGAWPAGAAAVKELYDSADGTTPTGYAYYLKTKADSAGGASWYWYERVGDRVVADGLGTSGVPKSACVGCHTAAGSDGAHTPSTGSRDFVYTPVR